MLHTTQTSHVIHMHVHAYHIPHITHTHTHIFMHAHTLNTHNTYFLELRAAMITYTRLSSTSGMERGEAEHGGTHL